MDKNSISIYGWIVVVVVIIAIMIAAATPFSSFVTGGIVDIVDSFGKPNNSSNDSGNIGGSGDQGESGESGGANHVCTPGAVATCTTDQICTDPSCGTVIVSATGHNATTEWTSDENYHWHECLNGCGTALDKGDHSPNMNISDATDSDEVYCMECEYVIKEAACAYIYMSSDILNSRTPNATMPSLPLNNFTSTFFTYGLYNSETKELYWGNDITAPVGDYVFINNTDEVIYIKLSSDTFVVWESIYKNAYETISLEAGTSYYFELRNITTETEGNGTVVGGGTESGDDAESGDDLGANECEHKDTATVVDDPTCTQKGSYKTICWDCGNTLDEGETPALGHTPGVCTRCGHCDYCDETYDVHLPGDICHICGKELG